jgi:hypothetical protein
MKNNMTNQNSECRDGCKQDGKSCCENNSATKECCQKEKVCDCTKPGKATTDSIPTESPCCAEKVA